MRRLRMVAAARYFLMGHEAAHEAALKAQEVLKAAADIAAASPEPYNYLGQQQQGGDG